jgi:hypothetical protein
MNGKVMQVGRKPLGIFVIRGAAKQFERNLLRFPRVLDVVGRRAKNVRCRGPVRLSAGFPTREDQKKPVLVQVRPSSAALTAKTPVCLNPADMPDGDCAAMVAAQGDVFVQDPPLAKATDAVRSVIAPEDGPKVAASIDADASGRLTHLRQGRKAFGGYFLPFGAPVERDEPSPVKPRWRAQTIAALRRWTSIFR